MKEKSKNDHWLVRPTTITSLWWVFGVVLAATILAQIIFGVKGYFVVDKWLGFGAIFGFLVCLIMVLIAKGLGILLKRSEQYYDDGDTDA